MWLRARARHSTSKPAPRQILVVDDDEDLRNVLRELLRDWGYSVVCAEDGYDAMRITGDKTPALIILDLWMPKMSGFAFRKWLLGQPHLADVPVLVLTAAAALDADRIEDATALYKPVDFDLLHALLEAQISPECR